MRRRNGHLIGQTEINLFEHSCAEPPCVITQMCAPSPPSPGSASSVPRRGGNRRRHCPSANGKYDSVIKIYVDGDTTPSVAVTLKELANVGRLAGDQPSAPHPNPAPPAPAPADPTTRPNVTEYRLGAMGATCAATCAAAGLVCNPHINTGYGVDKAKAMQAHLAQFNASITSCIMNPKPWWADDQPGFVCGNDPHGLTNNCVGWHAIPAAGSDCAGHYPEQCRVCRCLPKEDAAAPAAVAVDAAGVNDGSPFGESLFGHTARQGGVYSTVRIPFGKSLRATITSPDPQDGTFWFIIRVRRPSF